MRSTWTKLPLPARVASLLMGAYFALWACAPSAGNLRAPAPDVTGKPQTHQGTAGYGGYALVDGSGGAQGILGAYRYRIWDETTHEAFVQGETVDRTQWVGEVGVSLFAGTEVALDGEEDDEVREGELFGWNFPLRVGVLIDQRVLVGVGMLLNSFVPHAASLDLGFRVTQDVSIYTTPGFVLPLLGPFKDETYGHFPVGVSWGIGDVFSINFEVQVLSDFDDQTGVGGGFSLNVGGN